MSGTLRPKRFALVDRSIWEDEEFNALPKTPNARVLYFWLISRPGEPPIPFLFKLSLEAAAAGLSWTKRATKKMLGRLQRRDLIGYDEAAELVFLPHEIVANLPQQRAALAPWAKAWNALPASPLRDEARAIVLEAVACLSPAPWAKAPAEIGRACPPSSRPPLKLVPPPPPSDRARFVTVGPA